MKEILVTTDANFDLLIQNISTETYVAVDTETNWTQLPHERYCIGISFYCPMSDVGYYIPISTKDNQSFEMVPILRGRLNLALSTVTVIFHNAKFDNAVLNKLGIVVETWEDTLLIHYLINENEDQGLKPLSVMYIDKNADLEKTAVSTLRKAFTWEGIPTNIMAAYAIKDTYLTWKLFELFYPGIKNNDLEKVLKREKRFSLALQKLEMSGIRIDPIEAKLQSNRCTKRMREIELDIGFNPAKRNKLLERLYATPPTGLGLRPVAYGKPSKTYPMGVPAIGVSELDSYSHPFVSIVLEYRKLQKAQSTWYDGWVEIMDSSNRIYPSYRQEGTVTGRLSCANPNMQQVPRDTINNPVKKLLRAKPGHDLWEFDYSQVELRLAAAYANEEAMLQVFRSGGDPHSSVALALGIDRQVAKTINFLILYGGGVGKLFEVLSEMKSSYTWDQCEEFMKAFHKRYPGFKRVMYRSANTAEQKGYIQYWTGRKRHMLPNEYHKAFNSLIQGGAAEIMKDTMLMFYEDYNPDIEIVATIHDALWIEVPTGRPDLLDKIQKTMEWPEKDFGLPFPVDRKCLYAASSN